MSYSGHRKLVLYTNYWFCCVMKIDCHSGKVLQLDLNWQLLMSSFLNTCNFFYKNYLRSESWPMLVFVKKITSAEKRRPTNCETFCSCWLRKDYVMHAALTCEPWTRIWAEIVMYKISKTEFRKPEPWRHMDWIMQLMLYSSL